MEWTGSGCTLTVGQYRYVVTRPGGMDRVWVYIDSWSVWVHCNQARWNGQCVGGVVHWRDSTVYQLLQLQSLSTRVPFSFPMKNGQLLRTVVERNNLWTPVCDCVTVFHYMSSLKLTEFIAKLTFLSLFTGSWIPSVLGGEIRTATIQGWWHLRGCGVGVLLRTQSEANGVQQDRHPCPPQVCSLYLAHSTIFPHGSYMSANLVIHVSANFRIKRRPRGPVLGMLLSFLPKVFITNPVWVSVLSVSV